MEKYWFRPKGFWKFFAAYYPVSWQGWLVLFVCFAFLVQVFISIDRLSHSGSDTLIAFAPYFIAVLLIFDWLCFKKGLYPAWWKKRRNFWSRKE